MERVSADPSTRPLSEVARHLVIPTGIVDSVWFDLEERFEEWGVEFDAWQDGLGQLLLGLREDGKYATTVGGSTLSIPRQVAKTFIVSRTIFALCTQFDDLTALWTAHRIRTSTQTFQKLAGFAQRKSVKPYLAPGRSDGVRATNGEQEIQFRNGSRILFGARESGFGRGFDEVDVEVFDEAQILTEKALEDMIPATNQSRNPHGALLLFMGTPPRPVDPGETFTLRRRKALAAKPADVVVVEHGDALYLECSADAEVGQPGGPSLDDPEQIAKANASYPHRTPPEAIARMRENLPSDEAWRREALGVWDEEDVATGAFPPSVWGRAAATDEGVRIATRPVVCLDVRTGLQQSYAIVAAGGSGLGYDVVAVSRYVNDGSRWSNEDIVAETIDVLRARNLNVIVLDKYGENAHLRPLFEEAGVETVLLDTVDMRSGVVGFSDGIRNGGVKHLNHEPLTESMKGAVNRNNLWSWKDSTSDLTTLRAATAAWWAHKSGDVEEDYDVASSIF